MENKKQDRNYNKKISTSPEFIIRIYPKSDPNN